MTKRTVKTGEARGECRGDGPGEAPAPLVEGMTTTRHLGAQRRPGGDDRLMDQLLLGVSTRGYAASLEAAPVGTRSRATSNSAVSRRLVAAPRTQLTAQLGRRLDELDLVVLFLLTPDANWSEPFVPLLSADNDRFETGRFRALSSERLSPGHVVKRIRSRVVRATTHMAEQAVSCLC